MGNTCAHPHEQQHKRGCFLEWREGEDGALRCAFREESPEGAGACRAEGGHATPVKLVEVTASSEFPPTCVAAQVRGYRCTRCRVLVPSAREAVEHCRAQPEDVPEEMPEVPVAEVPVPSVGPRSRSRSTVTPDKGSRRPPSELPQACSPGREPQLSGGYICSICRAVLPSAREALAHCRREQPSELAGEAQLQAAPEGGGPAAEAAARDSPAGPDLEQLPGSPVAVDAEGRATVSWYTCPKTGMSATIVLEPDGTQHAFNENSVASLIIATDDMLVSFLEGLSQRMLHGLVHEVGRRLVEGSRCYQHLRSEWEASKAGTDYAFFGLSEDATEAELDNAYRQMARKMHPDKNDGTDEAKRCFQEMKELYEALKERRRSGKDKDNDRSSLQPEVAEPSAEVEAGSRITYDPSDRGSMGSATTRMLQELRTLHQHVSALRAGLQRCKRQKGYQGGS